MFIGNSGMCLAPVPMQSFLWLGDFLEEKQVLHTKSVWVSSLPSQLNKFKEKETTANQWEYWAILRKKEREKEKWEAWNKPSCLLTSFFFLLKFSFLLPMLLFIIRYYIWRLMQAVMRWRGLTGAVQPREFCRTDFFRAGSTSKTPAVFYPTVFTGAASGRQEALGHSDSLISKWKLLLPVHHTWSREKKNKNITILSNGFQTPCLELRPENITDSNAVCNEHWNWCHEAGI